MSGILPVVAQVAEAGISVARSPLLAPLNAAMGEYGAFEADGQRVEATGGTFVLAARDADVLQGVVVRVDLHPSAGMGRASR